MFNPRTEDESARSISYIWYACNELTYGVRGDGGKLLIVLETFFFLHQAVYAEKLQRKWLFRNILEKYTYS